MFEAQVPIWGGLVTPLSLNAFTKGKIDTSKGGICALETVHDTKEAVLPSTQDLSLENFAAFQLDCRGELVQAGVSEVGCAVKTL